MSPAGEAGAAGRELAAPPAFSPDTLVLELRSHLGLLAGRRLCLAYSGGLDSSVLLHALSRLRRTQRLRLRAVHVNHHLHAAADEHAAAAAREARRWRVPFRLLDAAVVPARDESLEAAARATRYAALAGELSAGELLLTAHHQEDQLETVLLALLRGSGARGLAAMRPAMRWQGTLLLRPLLAIDRPQLERYARSHAVSFREDPTNLDERFDRNYLRRRVSPLIRERWPAAAATIGRSAALLAEACELLEQQALADLATARDGAALRVSVLLRLSAARRRNALRQWIGERGLPAPDHRRLREVAGAMLAARADALPVVRWRGGQLRRHGDRLLAVPAATMSAQMQSWDWRRQPWLSLADGGRLGLVRDPHGDVLLTALPARLQVSYRCGGERVQGHEGHIALKDLLQVHGLAPWERAAVPLLGDGKRIIAVADLWLDPAFRARAGAGVVATTASRRTQSVRGRFRWRAPAH